jgi:hypothetical protein
MPVRRTNPVKINLVRKNIGFHRADCLKYWVCCIKERYFRSPQPILLARTIGLVAKFEDNDACSCRWPLLEYYIVIIQLFNFPWTELSKPSPLTTCALDTSWDKKLDYVSSLASKWHVCFPINTFVVDLMTQIPRKLHFCFFITLQTFYLQMFSKLLDSTHWVFGTFL